MNKKRELHFVSDEVFNGYLAEKADVGPRSFARDSTDRQGGLYICYVYRCCTNFSVSSLKK